MSFNHYPTNKYKAPIRQRIEGGLNLEDELFEMLPGEASILQNLLYRKNTPVKRSPFVRKSTESWGGTTPFRGIHEYIDQDNTSRLLIGTNDGKIKEFSSATSHNDRVTGLGSGNEIRFADAIGRVVSVNGEDAPRVGNGTSWRVFGALAAISNLAVAASGSGSFTGTYLHIVIPVKEIDSNNAEIYGDWSNIITTVAASDGQFDLTWTDISDSRCDKYWVFRTKVNVGAPFFRVARVDISTEAYTDTTADADLESINPPALGVWGTAPIAKYTAAAGNRIVMAHLLDNADEENVIQVSRAAANTYDCEAFDHSYGQGRVRCPGSGPIMGILGVGESGDESRRTNHTFIGQPRSCWLLPETDPTQRLIQISDDIGLINDRAVAQWNAYIFWIDKKKGLVFWRIGQASPWEIGDKINPVFFGGGNQTLTANQGDANISLKVWNDQLWITVRDDTTKECANKCYVMDLNAFIPDSEAMAKETARFTGPEVGPCFGFLYPLVNKNMVILDSHNETILQDDSTEDQDYVTEDTNVIVKIMTAPFLALTPTNDKDIRILEIFHYTNSDPTVKIYVEYGHIVTDVDVDVIQYNFTWDDIAWDDIDWVEPSWRAEGPVDWGTVGRWFRLYIEKDDADTNYAFGGFACKYNTYDRLLTYA